MRKAEYRRSEILTGLFITLAVLGFGLLAFRVGSFQILRALKGASVVCHADFTDVRSLVEGAPVSVAGRPVGEVTGFRIVQRMLTEEEAAAMVETLEEPSLPGIRAGMTRQMIDVAFEIRAPDLRLDPATASVSLAQDGVLGPYFLALDPGYWEGERAPLLDQPPGEVRLRSTEGVGMDAVIARILPATTHLTRVLEILEKGVFSAKNLEQLSGLLADLRAGVQDARSLVQEGSRVAASAEKLATELDSVVQDVNPRAKKLLDELGDTARELRESVARIEVDATQTLELTNDVIQENRPEVAESLRRLRRTMWEAEMAMRKIRANPAYLIFGDDEHLFDAVPADTGDIERSGRAPAYEQRDEGEGGG